MTRPTCEPLAQACPDPDKLDACGETEECRRLLHELEPARRAPLQKLRETIAAAAPGAEEGITYGMPGFLIDGRGLVGYMAFDRHYSFFPLSPLAVDAHREELGDPVKKGTISFGYGRRLPVTLVKKVVKTRLIESPGSVRARLAVVHSRVMAGGVGEPPQG
ncbi:MAG TPA: DUF1801 domain-containing protein [Actinomycetota bacterium]|nr:DUF1801 domain-containing protein [Actinomycetota bacterium]